MYITEANGREKKGNKERQQKRSGGRCMRLQWREVKGATYCSFQIHPCFSYQNVS